MQVPFFLLVLILSFLLSAAVADDAKPGCGSSCGDLSVPYPFGIGEGCFLEGFEITCNDSYTPPKPFLRGSEVFNFSLPQNQVIIKNSVAHTSWGINLTDDTNNIASINFTDTPFAFNGTANTFLVTGCNSAGIIQLGDGDAVTGCLSICGNNMSRSDQGSNNETCSGIGCCRSSIQGGQKSLTTGLWNLFNESQLSSIYNDSGNYSSSRYQCGYAFLVDASSYVFESSEIDTCSSPKIENSGFVLDWVVANRTCEEARTDSGSYGCMENSECTDDIYGNGYRCSCKQGYHGNPYLSPGCQDIDECQPPNNPCQGNGNCINRDGGFDCKSSNFPVIGFVLGFTGLLLLLLLVPAVYFFLKRRKLIQLREKFFRENGGLLLQQRNPFRQNAVETTKTFTAKELEKATDNYSVNRIIGEGGNGTVYQGILSDNRLVAVKKSKVIDKTQIEQFINEVVVLTQINHRNVVKLLGCCLETQVPLLVYEFVPNGSLYYHIHRIIAGGSIIPWDVRLRIAVETASALSYLHSAASISIIHRDVKSANILLDDKYTAKVSDFGASRLIPVDQTQISTLVQGTLGYLDPEYFQTSQLTEKSDVYSYGVVLVELLTGAAPISFARPEPERNLSSHFIMSMREDRLFEILEHGLANQQNEEEIKAVADLAMRCLRLKGDERPTMKEVVMELTGLRKSEKHPWDQIEANPDEALSLIDLDVM